MGERPARATTRRVRRTALLAVLAVLAVGAVACSAGYDAGDTAEEQLCDVLRSAIELSDAGEGFLLEPVLEGAAGDPTDVPGELLAIAVAYRSHESDYDRLGAFRPAIAFAAHLAELSLDDLLGPSELTPTVLESALAVDDVLAAGTCAP